MNDEQSFELMESGLYKLDPKPWITNEMFYEGEKDVFSSLEVYEKGKFLEARRRFVSILTEKKNYYLFKTKYPTTAVPPSFHYFTNPSAPYVDPFASRSIPLVKKGWRCKIRPRKQVCLESNKTRTFPSTPLFDSRSNSTTSIAEQKAKTWVVEENKEKPWNMEKVLEELGEVLVPYLY